MTSGGGSRFQIHSFDGWKGLSGDGDGVYVILDADKWLLFDVVVADNGRGV